MSDLDVFEARFALAYRAYLEEAPLEVDAVAVARAAAARRDWRPSGWPLNQRAARLPMWVAVGLLLMAALATAAIVGALLLRDTRSPLVPTGVTVINPDTASYWDIVADGSGTFWAVDALALMRIDAADGSIKKWTVADDARFGVGSIIPSHSEGVWIVSGDSFREFDGQTFGQTIAAPGSVLAVTEAPDGTLWTAVSEAPGCTLWALCDGRIAQWAGSTWRTVPSPEWASGASLESLAVDDNGLVWVSWTNTNDAYDGGIARFDGTAWTTFDPGQPPNNSVPIEMVVALSPTDVRASSDANFWQAATLPADATYVHDMAVGPGGSTWLAYVNADGDDQVASYDGQIWTTYGDADGLTSQNDGPYKSVAADDRAVFATTPDGVFKFDNGHWTRSTGQAASPGIGPWPNDLAAVSSDELWAIGYTMTTPLTLWHYLGGGWQREAPIDANQPDLGPVGVAVAPDGTPWAVGAFGVAHRSDANWTIVDTTPASVIAFDGSDTVWFAGWENPVWKLTRVGQSWIRVDAGFAPQFNARSVTTLLPDHAGGVWAAFESSILDGGLAHYDGTSWQSFTNAGEDVHVNDLTYGSGGELLVDMNCQLGDRPLTCIARLDGDTFTVLDTRERGLNASVAPDGALWVPMNQGPARFDGSSWQTPFADVLLAGGHNYSWAIVVAHDGTVFAHRGGTIVRLGRE